MMVIYHELLAGSYLLIPAPSSATAYKEDQAYHLNRACRSGKPAVWVDCRLLDTISDGAARLLWACHHRLQRRQVQLVLCRVSAQVEQVLHQVSAAVGLHVVPTLDDAAQPFG